MNSQKPDTENLEILDYHYKLRPDMQIADFYKLIYQSAFGNTHLIQEVLKSKVYFYQEMEEVDNTNPYSDTLIEPISLDDKVVRINFRPFVEKGYDNKTLFEVIVKSATHKYSGEDMFEKMWSRFRDKGWFDIEDIDKYYKEYYKIGRKIVHHSATYTEKYKPSYRVVVREYFEEAFKS